MSFFEFPHTRTYDSDLGWLIKSMEELMNEYNNLISWVNTHKTEYKELEKRVKSLENNIASFEAQIVQRMDNFEAKINNEIYVQYQQILAELHSELGRIEQILSDFASEIARFRLEIRGELLASESYQKSYTDAKIQELINNLPQLSINVYNPVKGYRTDIQTAINDLYDLGRSEALMAIEYDRLGLTALEYDELELTALQYDQYGKYYLEKFNKIKNPFHYMYSPFTGEYVVLEDVINDLVSLHKSGALTASGYDGLELEAQYYDSLELTAFDYDWNGLILINYRENAFTASEYDALSLDASYYDGLDISAYDYDWNGKLLIS